MYNFLSLNFPFPIRFSYIVYYFRYQSPFPTRPPDGNANPLHLVPMFCGPTQWFHPPFPFPLLLLTMPEILHELSFDLHMTIH